MTAQDTNLPNTFTERDAAAGVVVTRASRDRAAVIVWRTAPAAPGDIDAALNLGVGDSPLTARLVRRLVAIYSDVHSTVVDFDADDNLRHAAEATGRHYLAVAYPADLAALSNQPRPAALIMLRWPRTATTTPGQDANSLFSTCRQHLADDGSTIVAVTAGQTGTTYGEHEQALLPAAQAAGLRHLHDIVPLDATDGRDAFTYGTTHDTTASDRDNDAGTSRQTSTTLMVFCHQAGGRDTLRQSRQRF